MQHTAQLEALKQQLSQLDTARPIGRVSGVRSGVIHVSGLNDVARIGDHAEIRTRQASTLSGEVVQLTQSDVVILPDAAVEGVALNDRVALVEGGVVYPDVSWLGRLIDPAGSPLDGRPLKKGLKAQPLQATPPEAAARRSLGDRLNTGYVVFDTMLPIVRGQRVGLFAGSGVGKSNLMGGFARNISADVVVIALIGERGREVRHFLDEVLGPDGLQRSVIVAATSDQSPLTRRRCAWTAMAVAEFFRDHGKSVLFLADSITRFAEAHREVSLAAGEAPVLRGYPPSTAHLIMSLCERAGPGTTHQGDITAVMSVLVPGSDMEEPIADILRGVLDGHVVLDRSIAERGRFPAVDVLRSVSRSLPAAASPEENEIISIIRRHLSVYAKNEIMISSGLYAPGADPQLDLAISAFSPLDELMGIVHTEDTQHSFNQLQLVLRRAGQNSQAKRS